MLKTFDHKGKLIGEYFAVQEWEDGSITVWSRCNGETSEVYRSALPPIFEGDDDYLIDLETLKRKTIWI